MKQRDDSDDLLRKLFSKLPRVKAPADFEQGLERRLARSGTGTPFRPLRLRAYAVRALALLLIGGLSFIVYLTQFRTGVEDLQPAIDTMAAPPDRTGPESSGRSAAPRTVPQSPEGEDGSGEGSRQADDVRETSAGTRRDPSAIPVVPKMKGPGGSPERPVMGKTEPDRRLLMEQAIPDSAVVPDSQAVTDSLTIDSTGTGADSLADSSRTWRPY